MENNREVKSKISGNKLGQKHDFFRRGVSAIDIKKHDIYFDKYLKPAISTKIFKPIKKTETPSNFYCIDNTDISDFIPSFRESNCCFTWLAPSWIREEIEMFEKNILLNLSNTYREILSVRFHYSNENSKKIIELIIEKLQIEGEDVKIDDLPILILSKNSLFNFPNMELKRDEQIEAIILRKEFLDKILELPQKNLERIFEGIYFKLITDSSLEKLEKDVVEVLNKEIHTMKDNGDISASKFDWIMGSIKVGTSIAKLFIS
ncbi:MAG: hypothetical protein ACOC5T_04645 [Elusimicrobiota bacterium]